MSLDRLTRRGMVRALAATLGAAALARAGDPPVVDNPRATDGDRVFEPKWDEKLTLTVGNDKGDLIGRDDRVIQAALAHVARLGGGTVQLLPGRFVLRAAVVLPSNVRLVGSGAETILTKIPSRMTPLDDDSDWYDQEITLKDDSGFRVGDSVVLRAKNPDNGGAVVIKRVLVARSGRRFKLDRGLRENLWISGRPTCSAMFPLLTSEFTSDVVIENLTLDGDRPNNERLDGNHAGCIFLQDCQRFAIRGVTARNYNGDGISFQVCHDIRVENCHSHDNADLGVHPGSGSQRPVLRGNTMERNTIGLYWCWGVKYGLAESNKMLDNRNYGISIGHRDTDNLMRDNLVRGSGKVGILFRDDPAGLDFWPNRNTVENNRVIDSGGDDGIAIDVQGKTHDIRLLHNTIEETRGSAKRVGIRMGEKVGRVEVEGNRLSGFQADLVDLRSARVSARE